MNKTPRAAITGFGSAVPDRVMKNAEFEEFLDTSDEWITKRTGIKERRIVSDGESTMTLGLTAARRALENANVKPEDLDLIICGTVSPEMPFPATACFIQEALGIPGTPAFDISAACSAFVYTLEVADQYIRSGKHSKILIVCADALTRHADFTDRGSCILFGDAAGAVVLEASDERDRGVIYTVTRADGSGWDFIHIPAGGTREPFSKEALDKRSYFVKMRGRDVYKFAVDKMQWVLGECLEKCSLTATDVDLIIPHQVNIRIINSAVKKFDFPIEKVYINIDRMGNTSGASIPLALDEAVKNGIIGPGATVVFIAFGAGLTWAGAVVKL